MTASVQTRSVVTQETLNELYSRTPEDNLRHFDQLSAEELEDIRHFSLKQLHQLQNELDALIQELYQDLSRIWDTASKAAR